MKKVGDILRAERLRQGLTIDDLSQMTKIRRDYLEALEEGRYQQLPNHVYTRGFVLACARALRMNPDRVLPFYRREYKDAPEIKPTKIPQPISADQFQLTPGKVFVILTSIVITGFLVFLFLQYRSFAGVPVLIVDSPVDQTRVSSKQVEVVGKTDPSAQVVVNGEEVEVGLDGTFRLVYDLDLGINEILITAENSLGKQNQIKRVVERVKPQEPATEENTGEP